MVLASRTWLGTVSSPRIVPDGGRQCMHDCYHLEGPWIWWPRATSSGPWDPPELLCWLGDQVLPQGRTATYWDSTLCLLLPKLSEPVGAPTPHPSLSSQTCPGPGYSLMLVLGLWKPFLSNLYLFSHIAKVPTILTTKPANITYLCFSRKLGQKGN